MQRREWLKSLGSYFVLALATGGSLLTTGCFSVSQISSWLGVGIQAVTSIVNLLTGAGVMSTAAGVALTTVLALLKAGFADVQAAIVAYQDAPAANKQTALGKVSTAMQAIGDELQKLWSDLTIPDSQLASIVQGLIGIILSTIAGFMTQLPPPLVQSKAMGLPRKLSVTPQKRTQKQFVGDFNQVISGAGHPELAIQ
jgi:hypothetical protein